MQDPTDIVIGQPCRECGQPLRRTEDGFFECEGQPAHQWDVLWDVTGTLTESRLPGVYLRRREPRS